MSADLYSRVLDVLIEPARAEADRLLGEVQFYECTAEELIALITFLRPIAERQRIARQAPAQLKVMPLPKRRKTGAQRT
ncbi:Uncharacterised protein [Mycolicibacterium phlei]|jgi:hypothetical protein|uniref:Uncharacterized protein n=1 Tax=Mycolicibacterium phlei DSM 43239 = CCUG 21000 TaxID=1226750 RepID=A0A5N5UTJ6_MYCPH|nr:hypothetical protein [Mycolicibacterium phlei]VEG09969.1 Uncharacterised protein [Mycobacteroides chelonae]AMO61862.1 hypothetical protein MPHLCCUG_03057 [Mycolicibacterium phlei]EID10984.1 hypothetical protein MPHLEI_19979 [Mycolicibacterium phlei RIVM601174]KAB7752922.1 hypothetical protein MPHL21000_20575 [Mycolicibacterium phlei DSM 43239 = CCUG 21000]KXW59661.1 hypothetical protein MPHL43070_26040 [Mycolicibacterium phlei DSM 43070]